MTNTLEKNAPELLEGVKARILSAPTIGISDAMKGILEYFRNGRVKKRH